MTEQKQIQKKILSALSSASFKRRILHAPNAIQTIDN